MLFVGCLDVLKGEEKHRFRPDETDIFSSFFTP